MTDNNLINNSINNLQNNVLTIQTIQIAPFRTLMTALKDILLEQLQKINNFGFVVPKSLDRNGEIASMNMPGRRKILELINKKNIKMNSNSIQKVDYGSFNCIVFSKDAIAKCGYPNRDFFLRYDDVEYSSRISKEFNCFYLPNFVFIHDVLNSEVSQGLAYDDKRNYGLRNRVYASVYNESFPYNTYKFSIFLLMDIKKIMSGDNRNDLASTSLVDTLVNLVNKHGGGRIANKNN